MNPVVGWLLIGVPAVAIALTLLLGRSPGRAAAGFGVLTGGFAAMTMIDRVSGVFLGGLLALLYAAGRGGARERPASSGERERLREVSARHGREEGGHPAP